MTAPLVALLHPTISYFTVADIRFMIAMLRTMTDHVVNGRKVFSFHIPFKTVPKNVINVLQKYSELSDSIKAKHINKLIENDIIFKHFGWILSDRDNVTPLTCDL